MSAANIINPTTISQNYLQTAYTSQGSSVGFSLNPAFPVLAELPLVYNGGSINGYNITQSGSQLEVQVSGLYKIWCGVYLNKTTAGAGAVSLYIKKNGNPVIESAVSDTINQNEFEYLTTEQFLPLSAGDYIEMVLYTTSQGISVVATPFSAPVPQGTAFTTNMMLIAQSPYAT